MAKRIPYTITDKAALQEAYPELFTTETKTITVTTMDKEAFYQVVKLGDRIRRPVTGVVIRPGADNELKEDVTEAAPKGGATGESATLGDDTAPAEVDSHVSTVSPSTSGKRHVN